MWFIPLSSRLGCFQGNVDSFRVGRFAQKEGILNSPFGCAPYLQRCCTMIFELSITVLLYSLSVMANSAQVADQVSNAGSLLVFKGKVFKKYGNQMLELKTCGHFRGGHMLPSPGKILRNSKLLFKTRYFKKKYPTTTYSRLCSSECTCMKILFRVENSGLLIYKN